MRRVVPLTCDADECPKPRKSKRVRFCTRHQYLMDTYGSTDDPSWKRNCDECGSEFATTRSRARFCSQPCWREWWRKEKAAQTSSRSHIWVGPCVICEKLFVSPDARGKQTNRRCSDECKAEAKRRNNRERERRIFAETGQWRGRDQERKNPEIVERRKEVKAAEDAETPHRKRYPESSQARDARRRLRKQQNTPQPVELFTRAEIGDRDGWICQLCGIEIDSMLEYPHPRSQSLDHKLPISKGGAHTRENCQISHLECNVAKSDSLLDPAV